MKKLPPLEPEIGLLTDEDARTSSAPMCFSCGQEVARAAVVYFSHAPRYADRSHDGVVTLCEGCLVCALNVVQGKLRPSDRRRGTGAAGRKEPPP